MAERYGNVAETIAGLVDALKRCKADDNYNAVWERHEEALLWIANQHLPSGSGIDSGTTIDHDKSTRDKVVLYTSFHHIDEGGGYAGWTDHTVTVRLAFRGFNIAISGKNRNNIKEYLHSVFSEALAEPCVRYGERGAKYGWKRQGKWHSRGECEGKPAQEKS
jgi:hypothetical protein